MSRIPIFTPSEDLILRKFGAKASISILPYASVLIRTVPMITPSSECPVPVISARRMRPTLSCPSMAPAVETGLGRRDLPTESILQRIPLTISTALSPGLNTSQRAELMACKKGLGAVELLQILYYTTECEVQGMEAPVQVLVVKSDSAYLVNSMTEYIDRWRKNGYKNVKGTAVANADLFMKIDKQINFLNDLITTVSFWHVPRMRNREADSLAKDALDGKLVGGDLDYD